MDGVQYFYAEKSKRPSNQKDSKQLLIKFEENKMFKNAAEETLDVT